MVDFHTLRRPGICGRRSRRPVSAATLAAARSATSSLVKRAGSSGWSRGRATATSRSMSTPVSSTQRQDVGRSVQGGMMHEYRAGLGRRRWRFAGVLSCRALARLRLTVPRSAGADGAARVRVAPFLRRDPVQPAGLLSSGGAGPGRQALRLAARMAALVAWRRGWPRSSHGYAHRLAARMATLVAWARIAARVA